MRDEDIINEKSRTEWEYLIYEWVHNEVDREMLKRRMLDGITYEPLAEEFFLSTQQAYARVRKAKKQLFKHIS